MLFQDEARFGRINDPSRCWAPKGNRPVVRKQIVREYTYVYGAISPFDGDACYLILPAMDAVCMNIYLKELSTIYKDHFLLIVWDGAPCHSKGALDIPDNIMVAELPPCSPQLNPAENNWDDMREKFFTNLVFESMDAVEIKLIEACKFYEKNTQVIKSMAGWKWIIGSD